MHDILNDSKIDIKKEYLRLYQLFYVEGDRGCSAMSIGHSIYENFLQLDKKIIERCISWDDFDETHGYNFIEHPQNIDIDYLVSFAEYIINFAFAAVNGRICTRDQIIMLVENTRSVMADIGYQELN